MSGVRCLELNLLDIKFKDSPDSLNGLGIPGNICPTVEYI